MRLASHGIAGTSHSCHATHAPSGDHVGSKQKSAVLDNGCGHAGGALGSSGAARTWCWSTTNATERPSGATAGAPVGPAPGAATTQRLAPPVAGTHHKPPSTAAYTSASPSGVQSNAPPPYAAVGRGAGSLVTTSSGP